MLPTADGTLLHPLVTKIVSARPLHRPTCWRQFLNQGASCWQLRLDEDSDHVGEWQQFRCVRYFSCGYDKYLIKTTEEKKGLFWLTFLRVQWQQECPSACHIVAVTRKRETRADGHRAFPFAMFDPPGALVRGVVPSTFTVKTQSPKSLLRLKIIFSFFFFFF